MFDLKLIRDDPAAFDAALARRGLEAVTPDLLALDEKRRSLQTRLQEMQARRNQASRAIGIAKASGDEQAAKTAITEMAALKTDIQTGEEEERALGEELTARLAGIPNLPLDDAPDGEGEEDNVEIRIWGEKPALDFAPQEHFDIGEGLGLMDFDRAARMSGSRFVTLTGALARLERALGQFMLDLQTAEHGYTEATVPLLVRQQALFGTGQLPKFAEDQFRTTTDHWLIPTAEVPLTNLRREEILDAADLPLRFTALTPCFRSEAGSAGKDTRGMIRQHQFAKVEMVSIVHPDQSDAELERMTGCAEEVLKRLELPYRVLTLCTGDMGFSARKTYDLEVWLPGQGRYREISSCSNCGDFQARRMKMRYREEDAKETRYPHTLNGSGIAVGRALVAVLENYQQADGGVRIPDVLKPYMGGLEVITTR